MKTIFGLPLIGELLTLSFIIVGGFATVNGFSSFSNIEKIRVLESKDRNQVESWNAAGERRRHEMAKSPAVAHLPKHESSRDPS